MAASFPARSVRVLFRWFRAVEFKRVVVYASRDGSAFVIASPFFRHIMIRNTPERRSSGSGSGIASSVLVLVLRRRRASHFSCGKSKGNARAQLFPYYSSFQRFSSHPQKVFLILNRKPSPCSSFSRQSFFFGTRLVPGTPISKNFSAGENIHSYLVHARACSLCLKHTRHDTTRDEHRTRMAEDEEERKRGD